MLFWIEYGSEHVRIHEKIRGGCQAEAACGRIPELVYIPIGIGNQDLNRLPIVTCARFRCFTAQCLDHFIIHCKDVLMTPDEKDTLKRQLQKEIEEADCTIERLVEASRAVAPDNALGRLTRMETMSDQQMSKAKLLRMQEHRVQLRSALNRLPSPDFGICNACKGTIPIERLLAVPEARVCVPCLNKLRARK